jgi:hypothetical protein
MEEFEALTRRGKQGLDFILVRKAPPEKSKRKKRATSGATRRQQRGGPREAERRNGRSVADDADGPLEPTKPCETHEVVPCGVEEESASPERKQEAEAEESALEEFGMDFVADDDELFQRSNLGFAVGDDSFEGYLQDKDETSC